FLIGMWVVPPAMFLLAFVAPVTGWIHGWSIAVTAASLLFWLLAHGVQKVPLPYALSYPIGALAATAIFVRSAVRGSKVAWKGREYRIGRGLGSVGEQSDV